MTKAPQITVFVRYNSYQQFISYSLPCYSAAVTIEINTSGSRLGPLIIIAPTGQD